ncbi:MAG: hypothetical protein M1814_003624 [Vezdaea aestivalis]|nr:MAG: hypothetical protein M1814_003624 [Vezdaea aestivalis]
MLESLAALAMTSATTYGLYLFLTMDGPARIPNEFLERQRRRAVRRYNSTKVSEHAQTEQTSPGDQSLDGSGQARAEKQHQSALDWKLRQRDLFVQGRNDEMDPTLFIPLWRAHELPKVQYKSSDPEWRLFCEISRDADRMREIKIELIKDVIAVAKRDKDIIRVLGGSFRVSRWWIDCDFPNSPPPLFVRNGVEFNPKFPHGWAFSSQLVKANDVWRLEKMLQPSKMAKAFCSGVSDPLSRYWAASTSTPVKETGQTLRGRPEPNTGKGAQVALKDANVASKADEGDQKAANSQQDEDLSALPLVYFSPTYETVKKNIFKSNYRTLRYAERGTFRVSGLVEVEGPRSAILLDAAAYYDPKHQRFAHLSISLRRYQPIELSLRRGK